MHECVCSRACACVPAWATACTSELTIGHFFPHVRNAGMMPYAQYAGYGYGNLVPGIPQSLPPDHAVSDQGDNQPSEKRPRAPQRCTTCGHFRYEGDFKQYHKATAKKGEQGFYDVLESNWVPAADRQRRKSHKRRRTEGDS